MDAEEMFIRVQERLSQMLTPRIRGTLEYMYLFLALSLFCFLVVMHANYVQQPGCSSGLWKAGSSEVQLVQIKIASAGLWSQDESEIDLVNGPEKKGRSGPQIVENAVHIRSTILESNFWLDLMTSSDQEENTPLNFWTADNEFSESQTENSISDESSKLASQDAGAKIDKEVPRSRFSLSPKESLKAVIIRAGRKWHGRLAFFWKMAKKILGVLWDITGIHLDLDVPKWLEIFHLDRFNSYSVQWLELRSKAFEPTYLYTTEKGYILLTEEAKLKHNIHTITISISARHPCFGNRWQQLLINRLVGYDTILVNSLLHFPGHGHLYSYQTKEFYNLTYAHEQPETSANLGGYLVTKCGVLMMSLFVFFTTTMSVSFTLRETQARMLKFTVQLQHHARHRLPTFQLIFVHVIESLVFVPIMIGVLFFLFEFYDDQLLAFMVLILVWLCELFTLISVRTPISMKFFPRFFLLYFLVFHIYFFSYTNGFSYLALSTSAAFMLHLIFYFWNRFEVPALQRFIQNRRSQFQRNPDFRITSSTIVASALHIRRSNTRNSGSNNTDTGPAGRSPLVDNDSIRTRNGATEVSGFEDRPDHPNPDQLGNPLQIRGQPGVRQPGAGANPGSMSSFSSLLLRVLGGATSSEENNSSSIFRDPRRENRASQNAE